MSGTESTSQEAGTSQSAVPFEEMDTVSCEQFDKAIKSRIMKENEVYNGMTYSQLLREWLVWLYSSSPSYEGYRGEICFLSGNVSFVYDPKTGRRSQADKYQNKARFKNDPTFFKGDVVFPDTGIFIPVMSAFYSVGETYYGRKLETLRDCQNVCRRDIDEGGDYWCTVQRKGCDPTDLSANVIRIESPSVYITVTEDSLLRDRFEMPIDPGTYETYCVANVLMIKGLPYFAKADENLSEYRVHYGGYGRGNYVSNSYVDFIVSSDGRRSLSPNFRIAPVVKPTSELRGRKLRINLRPPDDPEDLAEFV
jgi:hypothetical protein